MTTYAALVDTGRHVCYHDFMTYTVRLYTGRHADEPLADVVVTDENVRSFNPYFTATDEENEIVMQAAREWFHDWCETAHDEDEDVKIVAVITGMAIVTPDNTSEILS